ncbi:hypothetical protein [Encephalitozoon cuniculi GB-M1]|uniref:DH domain-containing protein n=1 Tax=Encephalitozoon cuniculi (strain GB-M1) TaxID=284813 RepID=Q8SW55_ENCCU|nr:uncharacterized protein ECU03_0550 [Encephalitozoon cuniculi GB-M1]CAD26201.2 hypothetical protein [Encephalitozoon cuniculi GB-M1]
MSRSRKLIEALEEIFESEKSYIRDLILWERDFRIWVLNCPLFSSPKVKYEICDRVFINMDRIQRLHQRIYEDMRKMNFGAGFETMGKDALNNANEHATEKAEGSSANLRQLECVSIYERYVDEFTVYYEYVRRLPKAEFELEKLMYRYPDFASGVKDFLEQKNAEFLGIKHFLYRPSQKLARYPLLLKAVVKNEEGGLKDAYERLVESFKAIAKNADREFNKYGTQFAIYRLGMSFKYKGTVRNQQCLALFQKKRKLLKEGEALVRSSTREGSAVYKVFVFDHLILICDYPQNKFADLYINDEPIFMPRLIALKEDPGFFDKDEDFEEFSSLFLFEAGSAKAWGLYFHDQGERDVYFKIIQKAVHRVRAKLRDDISLRTLPFETGETVRYACQANNTDWRGESFSSSNSGEESSYMSTDGDSLDSAEMLKPAGCDSLDEAVNAFFENRNNSSKDGEDPYEEDHDGSEDSLEPGSNKTWSLWKTLFPTADFFVSSIKLPLPLDRSNDPEYTSAQKSMYIIAVGDGVYRFFNQKIDRILERKVSKIIYDSTYELMMYQSGSTLYASHFNVESTSIEENVLKSDIENFFYGVTKQGPCIASTDSGDGKSVSIFLFLAVISNEAVTIELSRKLYVGLQVYNVFFCSEKIVIACRDFEIVDMESLRTEELLQVYDPCIPVLFYGLKNTTARSILPVSPREFLLCFDSVGFIVDDTGKLKRTDIIFLWNCRPVEFKLSKNYVICLGHRIINIFDLRTGLLIFTKLQHGLRFVTGSLEPLLHDGKNFYKITFEADVDEANERSNKSHRDEEISAK